MPTRGLVTPLRPPRFGFLVCRAISLSFVEASSCRISRRVLHEPTRGLYRVMWLQGADPTHQRRPAEARECGPPAKRLARLASLPLEDDSAGQLSRPWPGLSMRQPCAHRVTVTR